jgi:prepilin-type processing-associated H-X9-DG protein
MPWAIYENVATHVSYMTFQDAMWTVLPEPSNFEVQGAVIASLDSNMQITDDIIGEFQTWTLPEQTNAWNGAFPGTAEFDLPMEPEGNAGGDTVYRLREGIERFLITDINNPAGSAMAQSEMAVMHDLIQVEQFWNYPDGEVGDVIFNHVPGGGNVLYMDGHVEWKKYPQKDPPINPIAIGIWF